MKRERRRRRERRVTVLVPSIFTLANLFFGIWAMVLTVEGDYYRASWWIVIAGVLDMLDGRIARMSNTGSRFGAELDSLVDLVSFGVAPAFLVSYQLFFALGDFAWLFAYGFIVCVTLRLARFNLKLPDDIKPRGTFTGLPSPAAGITLATYYPFTQTTLYQSQLSNLPWSQIVIFVTIALGLAMVSNIQYAGLPRIGIKTVKGLLGLAVHVLIIGFGFWERDVFFFPFALTYVSYGLVRAVVVGLLERGDDSDEGDGTTAVTTDLPPQVRELKLNGR
ncbi:MAG: CDP-diacylglycerol--serine O-phosphatidyltransferase [Gemmatimonadales bacterium]